MFLLLLAMVVTAVAASQEFSSGERRVHLLELYTSEGCSSCPPAEEKLTALGRDSRLWRDFVPVSFHVNYWDRLGWPDRFARNEFTRREYNYAAAWGSSTVYTPCFVLDGADLGGRLSAAALSNSEPAGRLRANFTDGIVRIEYAASGASDLEVHVALLGSGITSRVTAGENDGRMLRHDFVVLGLVHALLREGHAELAPPAPNTAGIPRRALAIWVTRRGEQTPLQATGGWLDQVP